MADRWRPEDLDDEARDVRAMADMLRFVTPRVAGLVVEGVDDVFSGSFVEAEGRYFIVTAHHCIAGLEGADNIHLVCLGQQVSYIPLGDDVTNSAYATNEGDVPGECDVAFMEITEKLAKVLTDNGSVWVPFESLHSDVAPRQQVLMVGFPQDRVAPHPKFPNLTLLKPSIYTSEVTDRDVRKMDQFDEMFGTFSPGMHLLLELPTEHSNFDGSKSEETYGTDGMSGAAVFMFPGVEQDGTWGAADSVVVGVYTGDFPRQELMFVHRSEMVYDAIFKYLGQIPKPTV